MIKELFVGEDKVTAYRKDTGKLPSDTYEEAHKKPLIDTLPLGRNLRALMQNEVECLNRLFKERRIPEKYRVR